MYTLPIIATIITLSIYQMLSFLVSKARYDYKIQAPLTTGHPIFERMYRTHLNFMENMVTFLPLVWIASIKFSTNNNPFYIASLIFWIAGRSVFSYLYIADISFKGKLIANIISLLSTIVLAILSVLTLF
jgi:glutathione S-transferase